jgi:hypothetical protein
MTARFALAVVVVLLGLAATRGDDVDRLPSWEARAYRLIVPAEGELKWRQIGWTRDLAGAVKQARKEKRPLLIWASGDDPLERC